MASHLPLQDAWTRARNRYLEDLTNKEKQSYMQATPETLFYDASAAEKRHEASSTSRGLMHKLQPFIAAIEQYGTALDVYSNSYPLVLSPLWGSIRVLLLIAREFGKYFEKLVNMFASIGDVLPRFQVYEKLFHNHERLIHALSVAYVDVIVFCSDAKAVFRRGQRASLTSLKVGFKLMWKPFERQFGQQLDNFRNHRKNVEKEAGLSHMVEAADARALVLANHLQLEKSRKEDEYRRVIAMIRSIDVETKHRKLQYIRFPGTGDWLLQNEKYLEWKHASSPSSLCCYGIPGSGKSVLASRVIDDLSIIATSSQVPIVYYYCDYADQRTLKTDRILGTILKQLIGRDQIPKQIEPQILRAYKDDQQIPGVSEVVEIICSLMQLRPSAYIVLDGLDECEKQSRQDILGFLERLSTLGKAFAHTFVTCRDEDQLLRTLQSYHRIQLTATVLGNDIESFVEGSVRSRIKAGLLTVRNPDLEHQIVRELVNKAQGMFLWIFFQLDDLCEALSDAMIRKTLRDLPLGLIQTYERILLKISKSLLPKQEIALRAFRWTVCCRRPLKIEELQEAVAFETSDTAWDRDKIPDESLMIETCRGLLVRDEENRTVRFAHHTVQQYLLSSPAIITQQGSRFHISSRSEAESFVGQVCVTYLCFSDFETQITLRTPNVNLEVPGVLKDGGLVRIPSALGIGKSLLEIPYRLFGGKSDTASPDIDYSKYLKPNAPERPQAPSALTGKYRLLEYIVEYWMNHTQDMEPALGARLQHLAMHKKLSFEFRPWGPNQHFGPYGCVSCPDPTKAKDLPFMSLFHYAAHVGHWSLMEGLVAEYCSHEQLCDETLLIACRQGQGMIIQNLMQKFRFNLSDGRAMDVAAATGNADILDYMLGFSQDFAGRRLNSSFYNIAANATSILNLAATNGHENVIDTIRRWSRSGGTVLFDFPLHINERDERTGRTALFSAVMSGNGKIVLKFLREGAELKSHGTTALHVAAEYGHQEILQILLEDAAIDSDSDYDAETKKIDHENGTRETYIQTLLRFFDTEGDTPLHKAAKHGHLDVVKMLVDYAANTEATTSDLGLTALHFAAAEGHVAVVNLLLQNGASPYAGAKNGTKPLQLAVDGDHKDVVRALLDFDYKRLGFNANNTEMAGLIETAAKNGQDAVVHTLLGYMNVFEEGHFQEILQVAKRDNLHRAFRLLTDLPRAEVMRSMPLLRRT